MAARYRARPLQIRFVNLPYGEQQRLRQRLETEIANVVERFAPEDRLAMVPYTMLRATKPGARQNALHEVVPGFAIDLDDWRIVRDGRKISLPPACGRLAYYLDTHPPLPTPMLALELTLTESTIHNAVRALRPSLSPGLRLVSSDGHYSLERVK